MNITKILLFLIFVVVSHLILTKVIELKLKTNKMEKFYNMGATISMEDEKKKMIKSELDTIEQGDMDDYEIDDMDFMDMEKELLDEFHSGVKEQQDSIGSIDDMGDMDYTPFN